jgi:arginine decarboxylase
VKFQYCFLVSGIGNHPEKLISFEHALRNAGIAPYNWIFVNSILPAHCELIPAHRGLELLTTKCTFGDPMYMVLSKVQTNYPNEFVWASIGASRYAQQLSTGEFGYLAEYSCSMRGGFAYEENIMQLARTKVIDYSRYMLHTLVGRMNIDWFAREAAFSKAESSRSTLSDSIVIMNKVKTIEWATAIAAAVFIPA